MIGMRLVASSESSSSATSPPFPPGIITSRRITSGRSVRPLSRPLPPAGAAAALVPHAPPGPVFAGPPGRLCALSPVRPELHLSVDEVGEVLSEVVPVGLAVERLLRHLEDNVAAVGARSLPCHVHHLRSD